jgi:hypothetical protein
VIEVGETSPSPYTVYGGVVPRRKRGATEGIGARVHVVLLDSRYDHRRFPFATESPAFMLPVVHRSLLVGTLAWLARQGLHDVTLITPANPAEDLELAMAVVDHDLKLAPDLGRVLHRARRRGRLDQALLVMRPNLCPLPNLSALVAGHHHFGRAVTTIRGSCTFGPGRYTFGPPALLLASPAMCRILSREGIERPLQEIPRIARWRGLPTESIDPDQPIVEINNPFSLFQANLDGVNRGPALLERRGLKRAGERLWVAPGVDIGDVEVDPTGGPVVIGSNSVVEDGVLLRGPTVLGAQVVVERRACVHRGVVLDGTFLARESFVASSVVSPRLSHRIAS